MKPSNLARFALVLALLLAGAEAQAARVWIAWDSSVASCRPMAEDFMACVLGASDFNDYTTDSSWGTAGRSLSLGGTATIVRDCHAHQGTNETVAEDSATFDCVEDQTGFDLEDGDLMMYFPPSADCDGGRNNWHIPVHRRDGTLVNVNIGLIYAGNQCRCQTPVLHHEIYEAAARWNAADCCNGQGSCSSAVTDNGWYDMPGCAGRNFRAQAISPNRTSLSDPRACTTLRVDPTAICAQPRADRMHGRCVGSRVESCELHPDTTECGADGCSESGDAAHCIRFGARCTIDAPARACGGDAVDVTVTCTNTGSDPWANSIAIGVPAASAASALHDRTWVSASVIAQPGSGATAVGAMATFRFTVRAPDVTDTMNVAQSLVLVDRGVEHAVNAPSALRIAMEVRDCTAPVPGTDAGADAVAIADASSAVGGDDAGAGETRADAGDRNEVTAQPGVACTASPGRSGGSSSRSVVAGIVLVALALSTRTRAGARPDQT